MLMLEAESQDSPQPGDDGGTRQASHPSSGDTGTMFQSGLKVLIPTEGRKAFAYVPRGGGGEREEGIKKEPQGSRAVAQ